ncbi:hypothetical protein SESBI_33445 [Sesbania bispinosa]|nr:hypothetical protein SESBI_33445 [Sesbania bispinosa]
MAGSLLQLLRLFDDDEEPVETRPRRHSPNPDVVTPPQYHTPQEQPRASFNNTGTQNMRGLINNTGYTKGNGNGSIIFGGFDSSNRRYNY